MTQKSQSQPRIRFTRLNVSIAAVVFLTLAGTGVASASWTAPAVSTTASVATGTLSVTQSGAAALAASFDSSGTVTQKTVAVTVTNGGTLASPYTLTPVNTSNAGVAGAIKVTSWLTTAANLCTASATPPVGTATTNWTNAAAFTGTLAPASSNIFCVRTSLVPALISATVVGDMNATFTLAANLGSWTSGNTVTVTQKAIDNTKPSVPGTPTVSNTTAAGTTLTWTASTDNVGVTGYQIYRGATLVTTTGTGTTYTDTGATSATGYSYTVRAVDAAGNVSDPSGAVSVTTLPSSAKWYKVIHANSGYCLDDDSSSLQAGNAILMFTCYVPPANPNGSPNQQWQFGANGVQVRVAGAPAMFLRASSNNVGAGIVLGTSGSTRSTWTVVPSLIDAGQFQIKRSDANLCLDARVSPSLRDQVTQRTCDANSKAQRFTMTEMN